ncbi:MAG: hypothetical protein ACOC71_08240 [Hyphomicrobiales bacterium]
MESIGGYMWLIIDVLLVAALAAAILWGTHQWRQRQRERRESEAETRAVDRVYREDDSGR